MNLYVLVGTTVATAFLAGLYGERWRARLARRKWQARHSEVGRTGKPPGPPIGDAADQLRVVMRASFKKRKLMSTSEARVFYAAEDAVRAQGLNWRVMAQVSLGEVLSSPQAEAYSAINSKRVDILLVSKFGEPMGAIEFQGGGHYQGAASARDAVKKEALRRAGVGYIEVTPEHDADDLAREIRRLARRGLNSSGSKSEGPPQPPHTQG